jgi:nucleotidyltransferase substrate binding protein (TIGR01987 family)
MNIDEYNPAGLRRGIEALEKSLAAWEKGKEDPDLFETLRSGVIQNFEVAYELCWKAMQRLLVRNINLEAGFISKKEFYRLAAENNLIDRASDWWDFHEARNRTSHIYDGEIAEDVFETARRFLPHAQDFLARVEKIK